MKLLMIVFVFTYFLGASEGLECWSCNDRDSGLKCTEPVKVKCAKDEIFCGMFNYHTQHESFQNCHGDCQGKNCMSIHTEYGKRCMTSDYFLWSPDPNPHHYSATVHCCQGDLCNGAVKLSDQNVFLCAIVLLINLLFLCVN